MVSFDINYLSARPSRKLAYDMYYIDSIVSNWYSIYNSLCFLWILLPILVLILGMERVASITSSYYKYSEAAILVFALDNPDTFHILSQHLLDIVTYAENAKIFL